VFEQNLVAGAFLKLIPHQFRQRDDGIGRAGRLEFSQHMNVVERIEQKMWIDLGFEKIKFSR